jgi:hypothetical protein
MRANTSLSLKRLFVSTILLAAALVAGGLSGCDRRGPPAKGDTPKATSQPTAIESILAAWEQGEHAAAVSRFLEADWSARPLFAPGSTMDLSEEQFKKLPAAERQACSPQVQVHLTALRELARTVAQAGRDAAAKNDVPAARKHFAAIQQCGQALDSPDSMLIVNLVGQALQKMAVAEAAKLPPS